MIGLTYDRVSRNTAPLSALKYGAASGGEEYTRAVCTVRSVRCFVTSVMITLALYAISTILLLRILIYRNILLKNCSGESVSGHISCDSV